MNRRDFLKQAFGLAVVSAVGSTLTSCSSKKETSSLSKEEKERLEKVGDKTFTYLGFKEVGKDTSRSVNRYMLRLDENNDGKADALWVVDPLMDYHSEKTYDFADINAILELEVGSQVKVEDLVRLTPRSACEFHILRPMQASLVYGLKRGTLKANF